MMYKIIAKVISNRLKNFLKYIISKEKSGFSLGRSIVEGIILAHETMHSTRKMREVGMILKLDIFKAYDLVDRVFLIEVLRKFIFYD